MKVGKGLVRRIIGGSLWRRIILAASAIVIISSAFYYIPRYVYTRPRFDEAAWNDAVALLKEEVGDKAVENRCFYIPRTEIAVPYKGVFARDNYIGDDRYDGTLSIDGATARLAIFSCRWRIREDCWEDLYYRSSWIPRGPCHIRASVIRRAQAERLWRTLSYLANIRCADAEGIIGNPQTYAAGSLLDLDRGCAWLNGPGNRLTDILCRYCSARYFRDLFRNPRHNLAEGGDLPFDTLFDTYNAAFEADEDEGSDISASAYSTINWAFSYARDDRIFGRINEQRIKARVRDDWRSLAVRIPLINRVVESGPDRRWPYDTGLDWFTVNVIGKRGDTRFDAALDGAVTGGGTSGAESSWLCPLCLAYLFNNYPERTRSALLAAYADGGRLSNGSLLFRTEPSWALGTWRQYFPDDPSLARLAISSSDVETRMMGNYELYLVTHEPSALTGLEQIILLDDEMWSEAAVRLLRDIWRSDAPAGIPADLRAIYPQVHCPEVRASILATILEEGGKENADFAFERLSDPKELSVLNASYDKGGPAVTNWGGLSDLFTGAWIDYSKPVDARFTDMLLVACRPHPDSYNDLARSIEAGGDERALLPLDEPVDNSEAIWGNCQNAGDCIRMRAAADPLDVIAGMDQDSYDIGGQQRAADCKTAPWILKARFNRDQLLDVLADSRKAKTWLYVYTALQLWRYGRAYYEDPGATYEHDWQRDR